MKKANIWNSVAYYKPALKKLVIRAGGVNRKSDAVKKQNRHMADLKPASQCKGKSWGPFVACLRQQLTGRAQAKEY